jgi:Transposase
MSGTLHLAQALSNRGRRGRKNDFRDAERLVKRLVSQELVLSFVPDAEQRMWRTLTRTRYQRTRDKMRLQNQLESLLEEAHIKLSSLVSDLLGVSARRMLKALADGETDPVVIFTSRQFSPHWPISAYAPRRRSCMTRWMDRIEIRAGTQSPSRTSSLVSRSVPRLVRVKTSVCPVSA